MESAAVSNTLLSLSYSPPKINLCISGGVVSVSDLGFDFNAVCRDYDDIKSLVSQGS